MLFPFLPPPPALSRLGGVRRGRACGRLHFSRALFSCFPTTTKNKNRKDMKPNNLLPHSFPVSAASFSPLALAPCFAERAGRRETRDLSKPYYYFFI